MAASHAALHAHSTALHAPLGVLVWVEPWQRRIVLGCLPPSQYACPPLRVCLQRPPRPPPQVPRSAPVAAAGRAHPQAVPGAGAVASSPAPSIFSRSLSYMPKSPNMPAPFR